MNPADALPQDYHMYFDHTWMRHIPTDRIVFVVTDGEFKYQVPAGRVYHDCMPEELECWFPRAGSYNIGANAVFIGRRARRSMKKSAADHYYVQWGGAHDAACKIMAKGENFLTFAAAQEVLNKRVCNSVAISTDLILNRLPDAGQDEFEIIYRGTQAGYLKNNRFNPIFDGTPAAKRAELKLVQEGVECI